MASDPAGESASRVTSDPASKANTESSAPGPSKRTLTRRAFFLAASGLCGTCALLRVRGYPKRAPRNVVHDPEAGPGTGAAEDFLSDAEYMILSSVFARILAVDSLTDLKSTRLGFEAKEQAVPPSMTEVGSMAFAEGYIEAMQPYLRKDLLGFLQLIEHVLPLSYGFSTRFSKLADEAQDKVLRGLEAHRVGLVRGGFQGLKSLAFMSYYRHPKTWGLLGYEGPLLGRARP
jgi:hypothetical protein